MIDGVRVSCKEADKDMIVANMLVLLEAGLVLWLLGIVLWRELCHVHCISIHESHVHRSVLVIAVCRKKYVIRSFNVIWHVIACPKTHALSTPPTARSANRSESHVHRIK
jgi:hypothetical protein